jgi:arginyl-tRNA synthetase
LKEQIVELIRRALATLPAGSLPDPLPPIEIERTRDAAHGDFASSIALKLARSARRNPRELAQSILAALPASPFVARAEVAGAGFINFHLAPGAYTLELQRILDQGAAYGHSAAGGGKRVLVEFVSANPTGPLHVGHGRHAAFGASLANLMSAVGYAVTREFYINDAGRQVEILAASVWLRYLELCGETFAFPSNGYRGDYLRPIAEALLKTEQRRLHRPADQVFSDLPADAPAGDKDKHIDALIERARALLGAEAFERVVTLSLQRMLADIRADLHEFGVEFESWYSERSFVASGAIDGALGRLRAAGHVYEKDGALWFRASAFGDVEDRVVVRENGVKTYFASDIAYHFDKRARGFEQLVDVLGADHHGYVARVRAGLAAMGQPADCLEVLLIQLVSLYRGDEKLAMGKREGQFVTLRQLRDEVGNDAAHFFYLMRSNDQHLDFDLELAKKRSTDNPVFYVQYAHARVASLMKELEARGLTYDAKLGHGQLQLLTTPQETALLKSLSAYPEVLQDAARNRAPHLIVHYLRDLASDFHKNYEANRILGTPAELLNARLTLALGLQQVVRNGLELLGVSAPESM